MNDRKKRVNWQRAIAMGKECADGWMKKRGQGGGAKDDKAL